MGGDGRPLVLADAHRPLVVERPQQAADGRRGEHRQPADDDGDGAGRGADVGQPAGAVGERDDAGAEQHDAGDELQAARRPTPGRDAPDAVVPAGPHDDDADGDGRRRRA